jgi:hypothetical protein
MAKKFVIPSTRRGPSQSDTHPDKNEKKAIDESRAPTVSRPGGLVNDPDDPTNPNQAIDRYRRTLRQLIVNTSCSNCQATCNSNPRARRKN